MKAGHECRNRCLMKDKGRHQIRLPVYDVSCWQWCGWRDSSGNPSWTLRNSRGDVEESDWMRLNMWVCFYIMVFAQPFSSRTLQLGGCLLLQRWESCRLTCHHRAALFWRVGCLEMIETQCSVLNEWQWEKLPFFTAEGRVYSELRCFLYSASLWRVRVKGGLFYMR